MSRHPAMSGTYLFGGYLSSAFFTISSSFSCSLLASLLSCRAIPRHTRDRVPVSRRSSTSVPSVYGTFTTRVPHPRHPAGYRSTCALRADPKWYRTFRSLLRGTLSRPFADVALDRRFNPLLHQFAVQRRILAIQLPVMNRECPVPAEIRSRVELHRDVLR